MNKKINIWGRDFDLKVDFDCYKNETITDVQAQALNNFISNKQLYANPSAVFEYCKQHNNDVDSTNIFKYVCPQSLYIKRTSDSSRVVAIMCAYKFDIEHGLAVVFKNEKFMQISTQDHIL